MLIKDFNSVTKALMSKIGNKPCIACGKIKGFDVDPNEFQVVGFKRNKDGVIPSGEHNYLSCALVTCLNCGFTSQYALSILLNDPDYMKASI